MLFSAGKNKCEVESVGFCETLPALGSLGKMTVTKFTFRPGTDTGSGINQQQLTAQ